MNSCVPGDNTVVYPQLKQLHSENAVVTSIRNLLTPAEAEHLLTTADNLFSRSTVVSGNGGSRHDDARTSSTAYLEKEHDAVVSCIEKRIATFAAAPTTHLEPLQVTDYKDKQYFSYHHDYFDSRKNGKSDRTTTVFTYLQSEHLEDGQCGGATMFADLKDDQGNQLKVYPRVGDAVMWSNRTFTGEPNAATLHSGEALKCLNARKTGLNAWFRDAAWGTD